MKSRVSFSDIIAPEGKPKAQELKDLDVDRVDGVDKPATGRSFLLFKSEDGETPYVDSGEMDDDERRRRGVAPLNGRKFKVAFGDTLFGDPSRHAVRTFPIEQQPARQPRAADTGKDALDREYADAVLERLGGGASHGAPDVSPIPTAGAGQTWEGDTRDVPTRAPRFNPGAPEGAGVDPMAASGGGYSLREIGQLEDVITRVGDFAVLSPRDPGIAAASAFLKPEPATDVLKDRRAKPGIFRNVVLGPLAGTNRFDG